MLEEPLVATLLRHKWAAFARAQFVAHLAGYLLLEVGRGGAGWGEGWGAVVWSRAQRHNDLCDPANRRIRCRRRC